jgi:hypothetical protein
MTSRFLHPSYSGKLGEPQWITPAELSASIGPGLDISALIRAEHSCCCAAKPAVAAVMPPSPGRDHATDLLLCMHHYRASRDSLAAAGAVVTDRSGHVLQAPERESSGQVAVATLVASGQREPEASQLA